LDVLKGRAAGRRLAVAGHRPLTVRMAGAIGMRGMNGLQQRLHADLRTHIPRKLRMP